MSIRTCAMILYVCLCLDIFEMTCYDIYARCINDPYLTDMVFNGIIILKCLGFECINISI